MDSTRNSRDMRESRDQMNEVGSSVALSTPQSTYLASSQPHLSSQPESLRKPRSHPDPVSSHILDTSLGLPAKGVSVSLYRMGGDQTWNKLQSRYFIYYTRGSTYFSEYVWSLRCFQILSLLNHGYKWKSFFTTVNHGYEPKSSFATVIHGHKGKFLTVAMIYSHKRRCQ